MLDHLPRGSLEGTAERRKDCRGRHRPRAPLDDVSGRRRRFIQERYSTVSVAPNDATRKQSLEALSQEGVSTTCHDSADEPAASPLGTAGQSAQTRTWDAPPVSPVVLALVFALHDIERMRARRTMPNVKGLAA